MSPLKVATLEEWEAASSLSFAPLNCREASTDFAGQMDTRQLSPRLSISSIASGGIRISRTASLVRSHPSDDLLMTLQLASEGRLSQNGRSSNVPAGAGVFYETRRPYEIDNRQGGQRQFTVRVPRAALDVADAAVSRTCGEVIGPGSPELRVLRTTIASLHEECGELSIEAREDLGDHVLDMIASLIRRRVRPSMSTPRLMQGLMAHIEENIHSPDLNVTSLAAGCFVSERSVYEAFAGMGYAPAAYITNLRIQRAERYLMEGRSVQVTAGLCGYSDPSTFIRAFRRVHHTTPKAWVDGRRGR